jgi:hypothetical protein
VSTSRSGARAYHHSRHSRVCAAVPHEARERQYSSPPIGSECLEGAYVRYTLKAMQPLGESGRAGKIARGRGGLGWRWG